MILDLIFIFTPTKQVVKDVVLTINQAIEPVEKGMIKIQETFHHKSDIEGHDDDESELKVEPVEEDQKSEIDF